MGNDWTGLFNEYDFQVQFLCNPKLQLRFCSVLYNGQLMIMRPDALLAVILTQMR